MPLRITRRFTTSESRQAQVEPESVRPVSPGYRLRKERRPIEARQPVPRGFEEIERARDALRKQEKEGNKPQYADFAALVERAARADSFKMAKDLLLEIDKRGMKHTSGRALRSLLQAYARCDQLPEVEWTAQQLWLNGHQPDAWCFNAWISALVRRRNMKEAEAKFKQMLDLKLQPTVVTYHALLSGYANEDNKEKVLGVLTEMERLGLPWTEYTWSPLIHMYARRGEPGEVRALMERLANSGGRPSVRVFNSLLSALAKAGQYDRMPLVLKQMQEQNVLPVTETYNTLLAAYAKLGDFAAAESCLSEMRTQNLPQDLLSYAPLIAARCKRGEMEEAEATLREMKAHNIAPSTSEAMLLINGWIAQGRFDRARQALNLMTEAGLAPSRVMYVPLVSAFAEARRFKEANEIADEMRKNNIELDGWLARFGTKKTGAPSARPGGAGGAAEDLAWTVQERTAHIKNLLGTGRHVEAERVLAAMEEHGPAPNIFTYTLLLGHYGGRGELGKIEEMLTHMNQRGVRPDAITYTKLMRAYASQKRATETLDYWALAQAAMDKEGKVPSAAVYHDAITAHCSQREVDAALALCELMHKKKIKPLGATYVRLLNSLLKTNRAADAAAWSDKMVSAGYVLVEPLAGMIRQAKEELKGEEPAKAADRKQ